MSEDDKDDQSGAPATHILDVPAVTQLIRDELDRNNRYLEFAQGQIEKDRSFYKYLYAGAGGFLAFMIAVAGFFSYTSVSQMRQDMKASVDAELVALRAQAEATRSQAQTTVNRELANVHTEVQNRIDTEFRSENIASLIASAAKERTNTELTGIIHSEAAAQVAAGIRDQSADIKKNVEEQTREAVKALQPTIEDTINSELEAQVKNAVEPVTVQMKAYQNLGTLSALARNDNRKAFDQLITITIGNQTEDVKTLAQATILDIVHQKSNILHRIGVQFKEAQSPEAMRNILREYSVSDERLASIDNFPPDDKSILPLLIDVIRSDNNLEVVATAFRSFDIRTKQSFQFPDYATVLSWWDANHASFDQGQTSK